MARETAITQEQINAAADAIRAEGARPTARAVRERIGSGSMATILKLFQVWQGGQVRPAEQAVSLPPALQRALVDFIGQEIAGARATLEADLVTAQTAQHDLIVECERQAATIETQAQALEASIATQAEQAGRMGQINSDLTRATNDIQQERLAAEAARTELAKALLRLEAMPRLERELDTLRADLAEERQARTAAEQTAAVAIVEQKASERRAAEFEHRAAAADASVKELRDEAKAATIEARASVKQLANVTGELMAMRAKLDAGTRKAPAQKATPATVAKQKTPKVKS